jgi:hypothetical protein
MRPVHVVSAKEAVVRNLVAVGVLAGTMLGPVVATAGGLNRVYLVPAIAACPGQQSCPRTFESAYTFDSIVLRTPATKYMPADKPSFVVDIRGVKDPSGALVNGAVTLHVMSGRVSLPTLGTFPDGSVLTQVAPIAVPLKDGKGKLPYRAPASPNGLITNGGGVEVLDPTGKLLAVTGTQGKP